MADEPPTDDSLICNYCMNLGLRLRQCRRHTEETCPRKQLADREKAAQRAIDDAKRAIGAMTRAMAKEAKTTKVERECTTPEVEPATPNMKPIFNFKVKPQDGREGQQQQEQEQQEQEQQPQRPPMKMSYLGIEWEEATERIAQQAMKQGGEYAAVVNTRLDLKPITHPRGMEKERQGEEDAAVAKTRRPALKLLTRPRDLGQTPQGTSPATTPSQFRTDRRKALQVLGEAAAKKAKDGFTSPAREAFNPPTGPRNQQQYAQPAPPLPPSPPPPPPAAPIRQVTPLLIHDRTTTAQGQRNHHEHTQPPPLPSPGPPPDTPAQAQELMPLVIPETTKEADPTPQPAQPGKRIPAICRYCQEVLNLPYKQCKGHTMINCFKILRRLKDEAKLRERLARNGIRFRETYGAEKAAEVAAAGKEVEVREQIEESKPEVVPESEAVPAPETIPEPRKTLLEMLIADFIPPNYDYLYVEEPPSPTPPPKTPNPPPPPSPSSSGSSHTWSSYSGSYIDSLNSPGPESTPYAISTMHLICPYDLIHEPCPDGALCTLLPLCNFFIKDRRWGCLDKHCIRPHYSRSFRVLVEDYWTPKREEDGWDDWDYGGTEERRRCHEGRKLHLWTTQDESGSVGLMGSRRCGSGRETPV